MRSLFLALLVVFLSVGCDSGLPTVATVRRAIANGEATDAFPSVAKVWIEDSQGQGLCTGTLISERTILTAAHCLVTAEYLLVELGDTEYDVALAIVHTQYDPETVVHDLGIIRLVNAPPVQPTSLATRAPKVGTHVSLVGCGVTHSVKNDEGTMRVARNRVSELSEHYVSFHGTGGSRGNLCYGDSGGPTFASIYGEDVQIGVHSLSGQEVCGFQAFDSRVDIDMGWIQQNADSEITTVDITPGGVCSRQEADDGSAVLSDEEEAERSAEECVQGCAIGAGKSVHGMSIVVLLALLIACWRRTRRLARSNFGNETHFRC